MSMHLLGPAYNNTNSKKRKSKMTTSKHTKLALDWMEDTRRDKKLGIKPKTFEEYVAYRKGNYKPKLRGTPAPKYEASDHRQKYPSQQEIGVAFAKTPNTYTGTLVKGIATMHKSNAVPIISDEQAIEVARMRRG